MAGFRLVELYAEGRDSGVVDGIGPAVEFDPQFAALHIGAQVVGGACGDLKPG